MPHLRLFATVLSNDLPQNSMTGSSLGSGLWQSDDSGKTWRQLGWKHVKGYSMDLLESDPSTIYFAAGNGVLRSTDAGETWKVLTDWRFAEVLDIAIDPAHSNNIYVATAHGPFCSHDAGVTWQSVRYNLETPYCSRIFLNDNKVFLLGEDGMFVLQNRLWKMMEGSQPAPRDITRTATGDWIVVTAKGYVLKSTNNLQSLEMFSYFHQQPLWSVATADSMIYVGGMKGVVRFRDVVLTNGAVRLTNVYDAVPNVHAIMPIENAQLIGSLGKGIGILQNGVTTPVALTGSLVWRIKSYVVQ